ncbi:Holliday junction resolvase RuvX [Undibacterium sp.]|uniref:Holliday junction resolvase RuvX n=1 Tax=Undibacterium sp. TaxID=1914977 RepID=UPI00374DCB86
MAAVETAAATVNSTGTGAAVNGIAVNGTILAFDFGLKRTGVAVGNTVLRQAQPLCIISAATNDGKFAEITAVINTWQPVLCVVGLPMHPDGEANEMTQRCRRFANQLHGRYGVTVELVDERYSSAVISAKRGERIDAQAAALILQQYFDQTP